VILKRVTVVVAVIACNLCAQSDIEKLGHPYVEKFGDSTGTLTYWPTETGSDLIFKASSAGNVLPSLEVQCELLDRLLGRVLKDHPTEDKFGIALSTMQEFFIPPLQRFLSTSPGWDSLRGRPRKDRQLGDFLTEVINTSGVLDLVVKTFDRHGLSLSASGMGRIDIQKLRSMNDARLPSYIWQMNFLARKR
jgi:hypothetical protein